MNFPCFHNNQTRRLKACCFLHKFSLTYFKNFLQTFIEKIPKNSSFSEIFQTFLRKFLQGILSENSHKEFPSAFTQSFIIQRCFWKFSKNFPSDSFGESHRDSLKSSSEEFSEILIKNSFSNSSNLFLGNFANHFFQNFQDFMDFFQKKNIIKDLFGLFSID